MSRVFALVLVPLLLLAPVSWAGEPSADGEEAGAPSQEAGDELSERETLVAIFQELGAQVGPAKGAAIGDLATIDIPEGYWLVPASGMADFNKLMENLSSPSEVGALVKESGEGGLESILYFSFDAIGYVKDDETDLDADDLLETLRDQTSAENGRRQAQGLSPLEIVGWSKEPFYNAETQSLEWGTIFRPIGSSDPGTVNYNTRRLGRSGVMSLVLATDPEDVKQAIVEMNEALETFAYVPGKDYASFQEGDHIAEIGLGALVVGGGAAILAKVGFFKKFWKILVALGVGIASLFGKLFGRKKEEEGVVVSDDE